MVQKTPVLVSFRALEVDKQAIDHTLVVLGKDSQTAQVHSMDN